MIDGGGKEVIGPFKNVLGLYSPQRCQRVGLPA
jgi:hypothetical protein